jgi:hypothetical protein
MQEYIQSSILGDYSQANRLSSEPGDVSLYLCPSPVQSKPHPPQVDIIHIPFFTPLVPKYFKNLYDMNKHLINQRKFIFLANMKVVIFQFLLS